MNERKRLVLAGRERLSCDGHSCPLGSREAIGTEVETPFEWARSIRPLLPQPLIRHDDDDDLNKLQQLQVIASWLGISRSHVHLEAPVFDRIEKNPADRRF